MKYSIKLLAKIILCVLFSAACVAAGPERPLAVVAVAVSLAYVAVIGWRLGPGRSRRISDLGFDIERVASDIEGEETCVAEDRRALAALAGRTDENAAGQRRSLEADLAAVEAELQALSRKQAKLAAERDFLLSLGRNEERARAT